ncbi:hypothetical protein ALP94_00875 [Pseudomonas savastanoi pv. glycinea]|uniref:hypothetical protein n=1 Tax=Pseudomonas quasicaspiana TaxID=2829821 RepID=UPI000F008CF9|nr:hypothetical protein [Pseudomonas quasicaspiana]MCD5974273.1 hypothetical protein [Pseudomonas quasicaspiana]RMR06317.1 hypothetical protein ALP94_00875 [Pseudomonas savastanoi pv. glycinea]
MVIRALKPLLLSSITLISACASVPELMARSAWEGRNVQDAYKKWGGPHQMDQTPDGVFTLVWFESHWETDTVYKGSSENVSGGVRNITNYYADETRNVDCKITLYVAPDQTILKADSEGGCGRHMTPPDK